MVSFASLAILSCTSSYSLILETPILWQKALNTSSSACSIISTRAAERSSEDAADWERASTSGVRRSIVEMACVSSSRTPRRRTCIACYITMSKFIFLGRNYDCSSRGHPWRYWIQHQVEKGSPGELHRLCLEALIDRVLEADQGTFPLIY